MEITLKNLRKKVKEYKRVVYSALSILFFLANYHICQFFYPLDDEESVSNWWMMKEGRCLCCNNLFLLFSNDG